MRFAIGAKPRRLRGHFSCRNCQKSKPSAAASSPSWTGARIDKVTLNRKDLRFPFPQGFGEALEGQTIDRGRPPGQIPAVPALERQDLAQPSRHDRLLALRRARQVQGAAALLRAEPRTQARPHGLRADPSQAWHDAPDLCRRPALRLHRSYRRRSTTVPISRALGPSRCPTTSTPKRWPSLQGQEGADQGGAARPAVVAGLGNIYVTEALHRAHILPTDSRRHPADRKRASRKPARGPGRRRSAQVLIEAIEAGGSTLRDFRNAEGGSGYFQHRFAVYDREGEPCPTPCTGTVSASSSQAARPSIARCARRSPELLSYCAARSVDTHPLRGEGSRVGGCLAPIQHCGAPYPHPTSPVEGRGAGPAFGLARPLNPVDLSRPFPYRPPEWRLFSMPPLSFSPRTHLA